MLQVLLKEDVYNVYYRDNGNGNNKSFMRYPAQETLVRDIKGQLDITSSTQNTSTRCNCELFTKLFNTFHYAFI